MGSPESEPGRNQVEIQHEVTLSPFLIAKFEVSQAEWKRVMGSNPSEFKGDELPVENVSWDDIQEFEEKTGLTLPTEAQWEYACRAGTSTPFALWRDARHRVRETVLARYSPDVTVARALARRRRT